MLRLGLAVFVFALSADRTLGDSDGILAYLKSKIWGSKKTLKNLFDSNPANYHGDDLIGINGAYVGTGISPTSAPNSFPHAQPVSTRVPTASPTTVPTPGRTRSPVTTPSAATARPSYPVVVPTTPPTPTPTANGVTLIKIQVVQQFKNINVTQYNQNKAGSNSALEATVLSAIDSNCASNSVCAVTSVNVTGVSATSSSRRRLGTTQMIYITYVFEGYSNTYTSSSAAFTAYNQALQTSLSTTISPALQFQTYLETYSQAYHATALNASTAGAATATYLGTVGTSSSPSSSSSSSGLSEGGKFGIAIAVILIVLGGAVVAYNWNKLNGGTTADDSVGQELITTSNTSVTVTRLGPDVGNSIHNHRL